MTIQEKLTAIQFEFNCPKKRRNKFGNYNYRSAEDIQEALKPLCLKYKVNVKIRETDPVDICGVPVYRSIATIQCNESNETDFATASIGVDLNQKGQAMPQKFGSASSYAKKYALGNLFLIDDTADDDSTNKTIPKKWQTITEAQLNRLLSGSKDKAVEVLSRYNIKPEYEIKIKNQFSI